MPEVSVIVPIYNAEKYLQRCIESILSQTFTDFELILVDDGSTDSGGVICDKYMQKDNRVRVIHKENGGISSARNDGINLSRGKWIMFCDDDDYVDHKWIENLHACAEKTRSLVNCDYAKVAYNGRVDKCCFSEKDKKEIKKYEVREGWRKQYFRGGFQHYIWIRIFDATLIRTKGIRFDTSLRVGGEDTKFILDYLQYVDGIWCIPYIGYYWIDNGGSTSRNFTPEKYYSEKKVYFQCKKMFDTENVELFCNSEFLYFWWIINQIISRPEIHNKRKLVNAILKDAEFKDALNGANKQVCEEKLKKILLLEEYYFIVMIRVRNKYKNRHEIKDAT